MKPSTIKPSIAAIRGYQSILTRLGVKKHSERMVVTGVLVMLVIAIIALLSQAVTSSRGAAKALREKQILEKRWDDAKLETANAYISYRTLEKNKIWKPRWPDPSPIASDVSFMLSSFESFVTIGLEYTELRRQHGAVFSFSVDKVLPIRESIDSYVANNPEIPSSLRTNLDDLEETLESFQRNLRWVSESTNSHDTDMYASMARSDIPKLISLSNAIKKFTDAPPRQPHDQILIWREEAYTIFSTIYPDKHKYFKVLTPSELFPQSGLEVDPKKAAIELERKSLARIEEDKRNVELLAIHEKQSRDAEELARRKLTESTNQADLGEACQSGGTVYLKNKITAPMNSYSVSRQVPEGSQLKVVEKLSETRILVDYNYRSDLFTRFEIDIKEVTAKSGGK